MAFICIRLSSLIKTINKEIKLEDGNTRILDTDIRKRLKSAVTIESALLGYALN